MTVYTNAALADFYEDEDNVSAFTDSNGETVIIAAADEVVPSVPVFPLMLMLRLRLHS